MAIDISSLLVRKPGVNGGRLCLAGTGTSVLQIASLYKQGYSAEEIGGEYEHIPSSHIYAALAYYHANRDEVEAELAAEAAEAERLAREHAITRVSRP